MSRLPVPSDLTLLVLPDRYSVFCTAAAAGFIAALVFLAFPGLDLAVSRLFYLGQGRFLFSAPSVGAMVRTLLIILFWIACLAALAGFILTAFFDRKPMGISFLIWGYIAACAIVGPGIVANLVFKEHWGRARPVHITEFGGTKQFTPALLRTDQCEKNCAFVSGEASSIFVLGFAVAFLAAPAQRRKLLIAAIAAGSFAGLIRIGAGGHFLSDVVFAGIFMVFVARWLAWLMLERYAAHLADGGPFHQSTLRMGRTSTVHTLRLWNRTRRYWRHKQPLRRAAAAAKGWRKP
jgi:lipid A 4'-phosphatase